MVAPAASRIIALALCGLGISASASLAQEPAPELEPQLGKGTYIAGAPAELSADEAAKKLANPNAPLASLTLKSQWTHWDGSLPGADGLDSQTFLFQPSFPFPLSETDTLFVRPAFPYLVDQPVADASGKVRTESGFGDMGMDLAYGRTTKTQADALGQKWMIGFNVTPVVPDVAAEWLGRK